MSVLNIMPVSSSSILPKYSQSSNYTIYANADSELLENISTKIEGGFKLSFPKEYCAIITEYEDSDSSPIKVLGGLVDSDYRGEIMVIATSPIKRSVKRGQPIAKMIILEVAIPNIENISADLKNENIDE